jgi:type II secretory pathway pseudopilin PulG
METQKNLGFTLLELIIIIVIMGIVAFVVTIKFPGTSVNLKAQTEQLTNDIRYTQNLSMARNQHYRLVITSPTTYEVQNAVGTTDYSVTLGSGIASIAGDTIIFNSKGVPYSDDSTPLASVQTFVLTNSGGETASASITPTTGRVTTS